LAPTLFKAAGSISEGALLPYNDISILQPFAKRLAVPDLGDFENKQTEIDPILGFALFFMTSATRGHHAS